MKITVGPIVTIAGTSPPQGGPGPFGQPNKKTASAALPPHELFGHLADMRCFCGPVQANFFYPPRNQDRGGEAFFATVPAAAESLARFSPPASGSGHPCRGWVAGRGAGPAGARWLAAILVWPLAVGLGGGGAGCRSAGIFPGCC